MGSKAVLWLAAACCLTPLVFGQNLPAAAPIPSDPLEIVTGGIAAVDVSGRAEIVQLLERARKNYDLRSASRAYDLKVAFNVNSGGQTEHDGAWQMEDIFEPGQGLRWTAKDAGTYAITRISKNGMLFGEETASYIPLRLQEARATMFDPIPAAAYLNRASMRTTAAVYNGASVTCVLLSGPGNVSRASAARRWDESEECVDPQSGLLRVHSQVAGRYAAYDYTDAPQLAGHTLARKVIVTEGGKAVTTISVESLTEPAASDPSLFAPTEEMRARGRAIGTGAAQKISRVFRGTRNSRDPKSQTVCVFGVVTPSGQLAEVHSLQPANPNSEAAVEAVKQMNFAGAAPSKIQPQQHFVFVVGTFVSRP